VHSSATTAIHGINPDRPSIPRLKQPLFLPPVPWLTKVDGLRSVNHAIPPKRKRPDWASGRDARKAAAVRRARRLARECKASVFFWEVERDGKTFWTLDPGYVTGLGKYFVVSPEGKVLDEGETVSDRRDRS
jgi:hypothetical protein